MIPLSVSATIDVLEEGNIYIDILNINDDNYKAMLYREDGVIEYEVSIYNFRGHKLELVGKVIDGWTEKSDDRKSI